MSASASFVGDRGLTSFRDAVAGSLVPQEIVPERGQRFCARVATVSAAGMTVLTTNVTPLRAHRTLKSTCDDSSAFIMYVVSGHGDLVHRSGVEKLQAGSTLVIPANEGFDVTYGKPSQLVFLAIPGGLVDAIYTKLRGPIRSAELGAMGRTVTSSLSHVPDSASAEMATALRTVAELVAFSGRVSASALRAQAERVIEDNLSDQRLGVDFVATVLGVSPRTLERAFDGEGVAHAIRSRRLEVAAARLAAMPSSPIAHVAADLGFGSASRFAAYFRDRFGVTPHQWREAGTVVAQSESNRM